MNPKDLKKGSLYTTAYSNSVLVYFGETKADYYGFYVHHYKFFNLHTGRIKLVNPNIIHMTMYKLA